MLSRKPDFNARNRVRLAFPTHALRNHAVVLWRGVEARPAGNNAGLRAERQTGRQGRFDVPRGDLDARIHQPRPHGDDVLALHERLRLGVVSLQPRHNLLQIPGPEHVGRYRVLERAQVPHPALLVEVVRVDEDAPEVARPVLDVGKFRAELVAEALGDPLLCDPADPPLLDRVVVRLPPLEADDQVVVEVLVRPAARLAAEGPLEPGDGVLQAPGEPRVRAVEDEDDGVDVVELLHGADDAAEVLLVGALRVVEPGRVHAPERALGLAAEPEVLGGRAPRRLRPGAVADLEGARVPCPLLPGERRAERRLARARAADEHHAAGLVLEEPDLVGRGRAALPRADGHARLAARQLVGLACRPLPQKLSGRDAALLEGLVLDEPGAELGAVHKAVPVAVQQREELRHVVRLQPGLEEPGFHFGEGQPPVAVGVQRVEDLLGRSERRCVWARGDDRPLLASGAGADLRQATCVSAAERRTRVLGGISIETSALNAKVWRTMSVAVGAALAVSLVNPSFPGISDIFFSSSYSPYHFNRFQSNTYTLSTESALLTFGFLGSTISRENTRTVGSGLRSPGIFE